MIRDLLLRLTIRIMIKSLLSARKCQADDRAYPGNIVCNQYIKSSVISDYSVTEQLLRHFIQKTMGRRAYRKPYISICVPSGVTEVERRAVEEAAYQAGAREGDNCR